MISKNINSAFKKNLLFLLLLPGILVSQEFGLYGNFLGSESNQLILSYRNHSNELVTDTMAITNGKFFTEGIINGVQRVYISSITASNSMEDPNLVRFFLEPGKIEVFLEENNFQSITVKGSKTQSEFENLEKKILPLRKEINEISQEVDSLADQTQEKENLMKLRSLWHSKLNEIKDLEIKYAFKNPDSDLSSYYGSFYKRNISTDSLIFLYKSFSPRVTNNIYTEGIKKFLNIKPVDIGEKAPYFMSIDSNGKKITLNDFKGQYLLLDFWAGWCKPCIEKHPELKKIYKRFNSKGLEILGVSFDKNEKEWKKNIFNLNLNTWPQVFVGLDNIRQKGSISQIYDIQPIPAYILINQRGEIVGRYLSASAENKDFSQLQNELNKIFD